MRTARCSGCLSYHECPSAMHVPSPAMHTALPCMSPAMHTVLPCMPPATHAPAMHAPARHAPLPHTHPSPWIPPFATHAPFATYAHPCGQKDTCENITFANFVCGAVIKENMTMTLLKAIYMIYLRSVVLQEQLQVSFGSHMGRRFVCSWPGVHLPHSDI